ncbi:MAG TPA: Ig-like domain repeat protein [Terriglobales bacterium]|nr:Ig-like domain repeat protein [Terriglobales bacterium]
MWQYVLLLFVFPGFVFAQDTQSQSALAQPIDGSRRITLKHNVPVQARAEADRGTAPDSLPMHRMLLLLNRSPEREVALQQLLTEQQTKGTANYHRWLSPSDFGRQFGLSDADLQTVSSWLMSQGFQITHVAPGRNVIEFSGTAGAVRGTFHTAIHKFLVNGREHWSNINDPQIPAALAPLVKGIVSLNNFPLKPMNRVAGTFRRSADGTLEPLFTFTPPGSSTFYGVGPADFDTIYNVPSSLDGSGQTIAIVSPTNINIQDVANFRGIFGLPANAPNVILNGPDPGLIPGVEMEAVTDVEWSGAVAPQAKIDLVVSEATEDTFGIDLSALYIIQNNLAPVLSMSYGACEPELSTFNQFFNDMWEQAAAQGITVLVSTGDDGAAGCDDPNGTQASQGLAVNGFASTPFNVAVGGTDFNQNAGNASTYWNASNATSTQGSAKSYIPEIPWNDSCAAGGSLTGCANATNSFQDGGSGGFSTVWPKPSWQSGTGVPSDGHRDIPDVSMFAAAGGHRSLYLVCESDLLAPNTACDLNSPFTDFTGLGGTSVSVQVFAGVMALVNQFQKNNGGSDRQGNANFTLYKLAQNQISNKTVCDSTGSPDTANCIFYDITQGNNSVACTGGSPNCSTPTGTEGVLVQPSSSSTLAWVATTGYDLATGLGTVNVNNLVTKWSSAAFTPTSTTITSVSPISSIHGQAVTVNMTVSPASPNNVLVSLIARLPGGDRTIASAPAVTGLATLSTKGLPGGSYSVIAHYSGDGVFAASDSNLFGPVTVTPEGSQTFLGLVTIDPNTGFVSSTNAASTPYGSPYIFRMDVTGSAGSRTAHCTQTSAIPFICPTGSIALTANGTPLDAGTFKLNSEGFAEDQPIQLKAGSYSLQGVYSGDNSYNASTGTDTITITPAATSMNAVSTSVSNVPLNSPVVLNVSVNTQSNGAAPSGTVTFSDNGKALTGSVSYSGSPATGSAAASLQASLTTSFTLPGQHSLTASYSGDNDYAASTSSAGALTVTGPDFAFTSAPVSFDIIAGGSATATISVSWLSGFSPAVALSCAVPTNMSLASCSVTPTSVSPASGNAAATATLTVTTTASRVAALHPADPWVLGTGAVFAGVFLMGIPDKRRRGKFLAALILGTVALGSVNCGSGSSGSNNKQTTIPGTPSGSYTVVVTGSALDNGQTLTHQENVTVGVQ